MADVKRESRKVAHASFWFIDAEGRNRVALRGDTIEVAPEDMERGDRLGAFVTDPEPTGPTESDAAAASDSKPAKVNDILAEVGTDKEKAAAALETEKARGDDARSTLLEKLQAVLDAD